MKREPQDEYHAVHHEYHYDKKPIVAPPTKLDGNIEIISQCQHQSYPSRPVTTGLSNAYGFPHFYGPSAMLPTSFHGARPDRPIGKIDEREHEQERYRVPVSSVATSDSVYLHDSHRYEIGDYHGKSYSGMSYAAFRPSMQQRTAVYSSHHNNSGFTAAQYHNRKRKWSGAALRGMPPSMPVSFLFFFSFFLLSCCCFSIAWKWTWLIDISLTLCVKFSTSDSLRKLTICRQVRIVSVGVVLNTIVLRPHVALISNEDAFLSYGADLIESERQTIPNIEVRFVFV